ncbi:hypothetical protein AYO41_04185 [Verrucomicrobia bacterium SCGC AG-212-E04]|nr:hypothetical protein AYO41_04185 [Verrucomicrobia bacterium SCGC AG-212-E04]
MSTASASTQPAQTLKPIAESRPIEYPQIIAEPPPFSIEKLQALLDGEQKPIRDRVKQILRQPHFRYYEGTDTAEYREKVFHWCLELAREGIARLGYPAVAGGEGATETFLAAFETLAFHDLSLVIKFGVQFGLFGGSLQQLGTEYHHRKYLLPCGTLALPGCFAMTEIGHGSNVKDIETTATYDALTREFVIHSPSPAAGKSYIGNAAVHGRAATVFAQLIVNGERHGVHAFVVPLRSDEGFLLPGVRIEDNGQKLGLNGVDNGKIWFEQIRIPREDMLDRFATVSPEGEYASPIKNPGARFFTMLGTLVGGRISIATNGNNAAKSALTIAVRYAGRRRQFSGSKQEAETLLFDYPSHQRRLMPLLANAYGLHFALQHLVRVYATPRTKESDTRALESLAAGLKAWSTWNTTNTIQTCREACGGEGYLAVNRFAALKADTDIFTTFEGDNTVLLQLLAKNLLTDLRAKFKGMSRLDLLQFFGEQTSTKFVELNPISTSKVDKAHLRDTEFHLAAFRYREQRILLGTAKRMRRLASEGADAYVTFLSCQIRLGVLAQASVERVILEQFAAAVKNCGDKDVQAVLKDLLDLFALVQIEKHRGWYLEYGYLQPRKSKAIGREVDQLCADLRPKAVALVNSFGIPDECLAAPIALR